MTREDACRTLTFGVLGMGWEPLESKKQPSFNQNRKVLPWILKTNPKAKQREQKHPSKIRKTPKFTTHSPFFFPQKIPSPRTRDESTAGDARGQRGPGSLGESSARRDGGTAAGELRDES